MAESEGECRMENRVTLHEEQLIASTKTWFVKTRGLVNNNQNCFMNACLQALIQIEPLRKLIFEHLPTNDCYDCIQCMLNETFDEMMMTGSRRQAYNAHQFYSWIMRNSEGFNLPRHQQCDAHELLNLIFDKYQHTITHGREVTKFTSKNCSSSWESEETVVMEKVLPVISAMSNTTITIQTCVNNYYAKETVSDHDCRSCPSKIIMHQKYSVKPATILLLMLQRYSNQNQKISTKVYVSPVIEMISDLEVVKYDWVSSINHWGNTVNEGHYVTAIPADNNVDYMLLKNDEVEQWVNDRSESDNYVLFYVRQSTDTTNSTIIPWEDVSMPVASTSAITAVQLGYETCLSEQLDTNNEITTACMDAHDNECVLLECASNDEHGITIINNASRTRAGIASHIEEEHNFIVRAVSRACNLAIHKTRLIIVCVPKGIPGTSFGEKLANMEGRNVNLLLSVSFKNSDFVSILASDEFVRTEYDIFMKQMVTPLAEYDNHNWITGIGIKCILQTVLERPIDEQKKRKYEFFFDTNPKCLVTWCICRRWQTVAKEVIITEISDIMHPSRFICEGNHSSNSCAYARYLYTLCLAGIEPIQLCASDEDRLQDTRFHMWRIRHNDEYLCSHVLNPMFALHQNRHTITEGNIQETMAQVMQDTEQQRQQYISRKLTVYVLLLVDLDDDNFSDEYLHNLYKTQSHLFKIYVGVTRNKRYRKGHFSTALRDKSVVSANINVNTKIFLVYSEEFMNASDAELVEAVSIILLKIEEQIAMKNRVSQHYGGVVLLNTRMEYLCLARVDLSIQQVMIDFLKSGLPFVRFDGTCSNIQNCSVLHPILNGLFTFQERIVISTINSLIYNDEDDNN